MESSKEETKGMNIYLKNVQTFINVTFIYEYLYKEQVEHNSKSSNTPPLPQSIGDADAAASSDIILPKKLDFQSSSAADTKMDNKTDTTAATSTATTTNDDDKDQVMNVEDKDEQKHQISNTDDILLETKINDNTMDVTPIVDNDKEEQKKKEEEMLLHEQFDKYSNIGFTSIINKDEAITTPNNKKHLPLKEEPMYFESTMSLGKSRRSSASSVSSSGILEESISPVIDTTKIYEEINNINNNTGNQDKKDDEDEEMQVIMEHKDHPSSSAIEENNNNENSIINSTTNNNNKSFALEEESAMYFESTMSIGKSKYDDESSISSASVIDNNDGINNIISETLVEIEEMSNMKQL